MFLAAAEQFERSNADGVSVVGDSVWDMLAATRAQVSRDWVVIRRIRTRRAGTFGCLSGVRRSR